MFNSSAAPLVARFDIFGFTAYMIFFIKIQEQSTMMWTGSLSQTMFKPFGLYSRTKNYLILNHLFFPSQKTCIMELADPLIFQVL